MNIRIFSTPQGGARALARVIARAIDRKPSLVLGLPAGRTPIPLYQELTALCRRRTIDFSRVTTFNLDEFLGLPPHHPASYRAFMQRHLFDHVNLQPRHIHFLNGATTDIARECSRYEEAIARADGIDLQILGLGANGHIGFNEPGESLVARTHRTRLTPATRKANTRLFSLWGGTIAAVPAEALSMGMVTILHARRIVMLATGREKARAVAGMLNGPLTTALPASFLQLHRNAEVWLDRAAAPHINVARPGPR